MQYGSLYKIFVAEKEKRLGNNLQEEKETH